MFSQFNACNGYTCQNGGTCYVNLSSQPVCFCLPSVTGTMCEFNVNCAVGDTNTDQCKSWSAMGFCNNMYLYNSMPIPVYCPYSCRLCNQVCYDSTPQCSLWSALGFCNILIAQNNIICRKSCGQCYATSSKMLKLSPGSAGDFNSTINANTTLSQVEMKEILDQIQQTTLKLKQQQLPIGTNQNTTVAAKQVGSSDQVAVQPIN